MRKALFYWFAFLLILLAMTSCKSKANLVRTEITKDTIIETVKDTVFEVPKDSSSYEAVLQSKDGIVSIKSIGKTISGRKLNTPKVTIANNVLTVDCISEAEKMFASWKEKFIKSYKSVEYPVVTNELTWWHKTQICTGWGSLIILLLLLLYLVVKSKFS